MEDCNIEYLKIEDVLCVDDMWLIIIPIIPTC